MGQAALARKCLAGGDLDAVAVASIKVCLPRPSLLPSSMGTTAYEAGVCEGGRDERRGGAGRRVRGGGGVQEHVDFFFKKLKGTYIPKDRAAEPRKSADALIDMELSPPA